MMRFRTKSGSIALISVLIISAMLLIMVVGMAEAHVSVLYQYQDDLLSKSSFYFAESCLEETVRNFERDVSISGITITESADKECVTTISGSGSVRDVSVTTVDSGYTQNFTGQISYTQTGVVTNASLIHWEKT
jgi:hypothetical protein